MNNILITGGTGFLGHALIKRLLTDYQGTMIRVLARNEGKLIELKKEFPSVEIIAGSVENECIVIDALKDIDTLFHLAAFKHVGLAEVQPLQCTLSNVHGTLNLLKHFSGQLFVAISTDKAAKLQGVYGASKRIMEKLIEYYSKDTSTLYIVPRYGNVIGSTGSVIPKWIDICKKGEKMVITDPDATRFFFTVEDAVDLIFEAIEKGESGKPYIKKMKSCYVGTLARAIYEKYGTPSDINIIGLQPGENKHEFLDDDYSSEDALKLTLKELKEMI